MIDERLRKMLRREYSSGFGALDNLAGCRGGLFGFVAFVGSNGILIPGHGVKDRGFILGLKRRSLPGQQPL
jgi:hypothetical protein